MSILVIISTAQVSSSRRRKIISQTINYSDTVRILLVCPNTFSKKTKKQKKNERKSSEMCVQGERSSDAASKLKETVSVCRFSLFEAEERETLSSVMRIWKGPAVTGKPGDCGYDSKCKRTAERRLPYDVDTTELLLEPGNINRSHCRYPPLIPPRPESSLLCSGVSPPPSLSPSPSPSPSHVEVSRRRHRRRRRGNDFSLLDLFSAPLYPR